MDLEKREGHVQAKVLKLQAWGKSKEGATPLFNPGSLITSLRIFDPKKGRGWGETRGRRDEKKRGEPSGGSWFLPERERL